jgi:AcrR family transcriptional regulator
MSAVFVRRSGGSVAHVASVIHGEVPADPRSSILAAAEKCFARFGIMKTTMEDVARAANLSRATVYRYFADRDSLILESVVRRSRLNMQPAREYILQWPTTEQRIVEGILHDVQRGHRDPMIHKLVSPPEMMMATSLLATSGKATELTRELWEPILIAEQESRALRPDIDLVLLYEWIAELEMMCISQLAAGTGSIDRFRQKLRAFFVPALLGTNQTVT